MYIPQRSLVRSICTIFCLQVISLTGYNSLVSAFDLTSARVLLDTITKGVLSPGSLSPFGPEELLLTDRSGRTLLCVDNNGELRWKTDGTETGESGFLFPGGVASSSSLQIFVLDTGLRKIFKFDRRGSFSGYLINQTVQDPACIAQGMSGELYIYDDRSWELACVESDGSLRWQVKPGKLNGRVRSIRVSQNGIHLLVPEEAAIYSYGKFGEFLRKVILVSPPEHEEMIPVAFWPGHDGYIYVCSKAGELIIYDELLNPVQRYGSLFEHKLENPCDLFLRGKQLYLLDCGTRIVYQITVK